MQEWEINYEVSIQIQLNQDIGETERLISSSSTLARDWHEAWTGIALPATRS